MSKEKSLPEDVRVVCIQLVRGYDRRVQNYHNRRQEIISGSPCQYEMIRDADDPGNWEKSFRYFPPSAHNTSRAGENKAMQLLALDESPETKRMRAVEEAKLKIGLDLPDEMRIKLAEAIMLNCKAGRRYPYEYLNIEGIGRTQFYDRRTEFLTEIAKILKLI